MRRSDPFDRFGGSRFILSRFGGLLGGVSIYAILGFTPPLVADYENEVYKQNGAATTFGALHDVVVPDLRTMTDSDGLRKWGPHNLQRASQDDFTNGSYWRAKAAATIANAMSDDPDGFSAFSVTGDGLGTYGVDNFGTGGGDYGNSAGRVQTFTVRVAAATVSPATEVTLDLQGQGVRVNLSTGAFIGNVGSGPTVGYTITDLGLGWWEISVKTLKTNRFHFWSVLGDNSASNATAFLISRANLYLSDLGGMVNNPDTGDSYVPTTTAARFLPRRGNHKFIAEWSAANLPPESALGPEEITNGGFDAGSTGWELFNDATISEGVAELSGTGAVLQQSGVIPAGTAAFIKITWTQTITSGTRLRFIPRNGASTGNAETALFSTATGGASLLGTNANGSGTITAYIKVANGFSFYLLCEAGVAATVDNISVRKITVPAQYANAGLLREPAAATNLITDSNNFAAASWNSDANGVKILTESGLPDGFTRLTAAATSHTPQTAYKLTPSASATAPYVYHIEAKADGFDYVVLSVGTFAGGYWAAFNLATGTITSQPTQADTTAYMEPLGGGVYKCWIVCNTLAGSEWGLVTSSPDGTLTSQYPNTSDGVLVRYAQLEVGSVPSSYIPTAGGTVVRGDETVEIAGSKMPVPKITVIGPELVANGGFDTDTSDWTASGSTISSVDGKLQIDSSATDGRAYQSVTTVVNQTYKIVVSATGLLGDPILRVGTSENSTNILSVAITSAGNSATKEYIFVASTTATFITLRSAVTGISATFDNISVREITPPAWSIHMEGDMTYADTGSGNEVDWLSWRASSVEFIMYRLSAVTSRTGAVEFYQREPVSGQDTVTGPNNSYSPGINVPFNLASRHGTTFLNGAIDGVALTANTTPTILPDLSAAAFQIMPVGIGNVKRVVVWDESITDAGLVEVMV